MKTLYLECAMGASGDMLTGALLELIPNQKEFIENLNAAGLPDEVRVSAQQCEKCGITGTKFKVVVHGKEEKPADVHKHPHTHEYSHEHEHSHNHSSFADIKKRIAALKVNRKVKADIEAVYALIAEAESYVHNTVIDNIHFHEVGTADALADITAVCMLIDELAPDRIIASPVNVGSGHVHCAHGILPVPAPATARILRGIPVYAGTVQSELCTPTGAALLVHFAESFEPLPVITISEIGCGMGSKNFSQANCLRAFWGESTEEAENTERIIELSCNIDDMTGEALAFAMDILFENGALDVFTVPIGMKKSRPGILLGCLCRLEDAPKTADLMLRHTSSLGVRQTTCLRYFLPRTETVKDTAYGKVRLKTAEKNGIKKSKIEYEDAARIARSQNIPLAEVYRNIEKSAQ